MKIVSKFKDYYDGISFGAVDKDLVWVRETDESILKFDNITRENWIERRTYLNPVSTERMYSHENRKIKESFDSRGDFFAYVHFCGKKYPVFVSCDLRGTLLNSEYKNLISHVYGCVNTFEKFINLLNKIEGRYIDLEMLTKGEFSGNYYFEDGYNSICNFFSGVVESDINEKFNTPVVLERRISNSIIYCKNPCLKEIGFASVVPPTEAWQEISMWLGNFYHRAENETVEIPNDIRVRQHGFDDMSFRKAPTKRK